jgi:hypothetical protein
LLQKSISLSLKSFLLCIFLGPSFKGILIAKKILSSPWGERALLQIVMPDADSFPNRGFSTLAAWKLSRDWAPWRED